MSHALTLGYIGIGLSIFLSLTGWSESSLLKGQKKGFYNLSLIRDNKPTRTDNFASPFIGEVK
jgi:hypothetical protein